MENNLQLVSGDVLFDWRLCFDSPRLADPKDRPWSERVKALAAVARGEIARWVPVPEVSHWDSWLVLYDGPAGTPREGLTTIVPVLWHDLGHFKHLNAIREAALDACDPFTILFREPFRGAALLGFAHTVGPEDLIRAFPASQRKLSAATATKLRRTFATFLSCKDEGGYLVSMRHEGKRIYYRPLNEGRVNAGWGRRSTAKVVGLREARDIADNYSADIELA